MEAEDENLPKEKTSNSAMARLCRLAAGKLAEEGGAGRRKCSLLGPNPVSTRPFSYLNHLGKLLARFWFPRVTRNLGDFR